MDTVDICDFYDCVETPDTESGTEIDSTTGNRREMSDSL